MNDPVSSAPPPAESPAARRGVLLGAGALALLAGAGLAWRRYQLEAASPEAAALLWQQEVLTPSGAHMPLVSLRGRPLLVNFWATWCPPCVKEMPELDAFAKAHSAQGWQVLGLAVDQAEAVKQFLAHTPVSFPIGIVGVEGLALVRALGNPSGGLPFSVLLDGKGRIRQQKMGATTAAELGLWAAGLR
ncbi:MAG: redoxin [Ideonella sp. MAG2]|nr:MAG: redoxin [Ideonella sp. MAG2]